MRRALLLCLAIFAIALVEFFLFPGYTYLRSDTQILVPMLERLNAPNFLSRDMVSTAPHLVYTAYDEITLFLHRVLRQDLRGVLLLQLFISRLGSLYGVFLITSTAGIRDLQSLIIASLATVATAFPGTGLVPPEVEPVPHTLAFGFCLLAVGMLCDAKPLLSGLAGGIALLYDFRLAALFWLVVVTAFVCDRKLRMLLRPTLTILIVFVLLLANLAQLQPGVVETQSSFSRVSETWWKTLHDRTPEVFVSSWPGSTLLCYLVVSIAGVLAMARIWSSLNRQSKWMFSALFTCGVLSLPASAIMLDIFRWSLITQVQPARTALFTVALSVTAAGIAARLTWGKETRETAIWYCFVALFAVISPVMMFRSLRATDTSTAASIHDVADWADDNTWGSSMFLFPDAGRGLYPGVFRAESIRAVYADWGGGELTKYFEPFAEEWQKRWEHTMSGQYSSARLHSMLSLPIDYYVLQRAHAVAGVRPAFVTKRFLVYDAHDLRNRMAALPPVDVGINTRR